MASERGEVMREREQDDDEEEEYIDMDLSGPPAPREFEFMSAPLDRWGEPMASPADELFYKGKLLPLHLPPRIQMVEELLDGTTSSSSSRVLGGYSCTAPATPYESCTASPANSCYVSGELNVEEYFQEYAAAGLAAADGPGTGERKPWSRRLKFVRQLNLGLKLKASKAYLKTILFAPNKQGNAADADDRNVRHGAAGRDDLSRGHLRGAWRRNPFGQIRSNRYIASSSSHGGDSDNRHHAAAHEATTSRGRQKERGEREHGHRRSFSSVMVRYSSSTRTSPAPTPSSSCSTSTTCSSASSSVRTSSDSDTAGGPAALRRSSSASSEVENPIQGLIAYCKKSQQLASVRKSASDAGFRFLSAAAAKIAAEEADGLDDLIENLQRMKV